MRACLINLWCSVRGAVVLSGIIAALVPLAGVGPAPAAAQLKNVRNLTVVDAHNNVVGKISSASDSDLRIDFSFGNLLFYVYVNPFGFSGRLALFYESIDCSGPAWMDPPGVDFIQGAALDGSSDTVYVPDPSAIAIAKSIQSELIPGSPVTCSSSYSPSPKVPPIAVLNLSDKFTPPFRLWHSP